MALVKVRSKYQVLIPPHVREKVQIRVGDLLEASVERGKITFTPKSIVDREIAVALKEIDEGKSYGPFTSAKGLVRSLNRESRKLKKKSA